MMNNNNNSTHPQSKRRKTQQRRQQQQQQEHNNDSSTTSNEIVFKLSHLPLRPSTLSLLSRRGFHSTADVYFSQSSYNGSSWDKDVRTNVIDATSSSVSNLASELNVSLQQADAIGQEIENAMIVMKPPSSSIIINNNNSDNDLITSPTNQENQPQYQNQYNTSNTHFNSHYPKQKRKKSQTASELLSLHYNSSQSSSLSSSSSSLSLSTSSRPIISFVRSIDSLLGGGFHTKEVVEIAGLPGVGKTQLAMQICVDTFLPKQFGGVQGESIYIDTEGSFSPERCNDMAHALVNHVHCSVERRQRQRQANQANGTNNHVVVPNGFNVESILDSINVFRVYDESCQTNTIYSLPDFIKKRKDQGKVIKVVVIDSIAFHYRSSSSNSSSSSTDYKSRTKSLTSIAAFLSDLATTFDLSVLIINQMTTKVGGSGGGATGGLINDSMSGNNSSVVAALGESWAHSTTSRILLMFDNAIEIGSTENQQQQQRRVCKLVKSPHRAAGLAYFSVTQYGLRDIIQ